jgi:hypothetical protein
MSTAQVSTLDTNDSWGFEAPQRRMKMGVLTTLLGCASET